MRQRVRRLLSVATVLSVAAATFGVTAAAQAATSTGTMVVVVTDSVGASLVGAQVALSVNGGTSWVSRATEGPAGTYKQAVPPGSYIVRITAAGGLVDYVPGQTVPAGATSYPVAAGQDTTVMEQLSQSGNVQVSLVDGVTGAPVGDGCVSLSGYSSNVANCDHVDGRHLFVAVPLGEHTITVYGGTTHWAPAPVTVTVVAGFADHPVRLDPAAAIQTTVQASDNPALHPQFCAQPVYAATTMLSWSTGASCSDTATGSLIIGPLPPVSVQLFALPAEYFELNGQFDPTYGAQWVGASGGTGDQRQALTITPKSGTVTTIAPIRVDHAGSISGVVSDPYGDALTTVFIRPFAPQLNLSLVSGPGLAVYGPLGSMYHLTGLGPYAWPVDFQNYDGGVYAEQWSGGATNRYAATPVQVQAGRTSTANASLVYATGVAGTFYVPPRTPASRAWVMATNAVTGDWTGSTYADDNTFDIAGLNTDRVRLTYQPGDGRVYDYGVPVTPSAPHNTGIVLWRPKPHPEILGPPVKPFPQPVPAGSARPATSAAAPVYTIAPDAVPPRQRRPAKPWFF